MLRNYLVKQIKKGQLKITGKGNNCIWEKANVLGNFVSPWDLKERTDIEFRALWDEENLFFCFKVYDSEIYIHPSNNINDSINNSDRVELFLRPDASMNNYYCLEIDPTPRILDFTARPNKEFDFNWRWPSEQIHVKSSKAESHFTVEGTISLQSLNDFDLLKQGKIEIGVYRAKYNKQTNGSYKPSWITWIDPETASPNFHIASSFGVFELVRE